MKTVIRAFFRTLRIVLGPVMLLKERLTQPTGVVREAAAQASVDQQCQSLALFDQHDGAQHQAQGFEESADDDVHKRMFESDVLKKRRQSPYSKRAR
ncbi:MAG: hypothetical protein ACKOXU_00030 [Limnohabitans sp.]